MNTETLSALVASLLIAAVGLSVFLDNRKNLRFRFFGLLCLNLLVFQVGEFLYLLLGLTEVKLVSYAAASFIPVTAIKFFVVFHETDPLLPRPVEKPVVVLSLIFFLGAFYLWLFTSERALKVYSGALIGYVVLALGRCMHMAYQKSLQAGTSVERTRLRYLAISGLVAIVSVPMAQLPNVDPVISAVGKLLWVLYLYFLSQMLFHFRLMDLQDVLARLAILSSLVVIMTGIYAALLVWVGSDQPGLFIYNTLMASLVVIILLDPLKSTVEKRVHQTVFRERHELKRRVESLRLVLSQTLETEPLLDKLMTGLEETRRVTQAAVYITTVDGTTFVLKSHLGPVVKDSLDTVTSRVFLERLRMDGSLVLENLLRAREAQTSSGDESDPEDRALDSVIRVLNELEASACFPLAADGHMLGILTVRDDRMRDAYSPEEVEQFSSLAEQLSISIQNSRVYERMKERDRLAALGEMSAGLAHEIRNPLGAIKGAAQFLQDADEVFEKDGGKTHSGDKGEEKVGPRSDNEAQEFLGIIIEEVNRLNRVVSQFLDYARPERQTTGEFLNINNVLLKSVKMLTPQKSAVDITLDLDENIPRVFGNSQGLHQVFLNLGLNALQAMGDHGELNIQTFVRSDIWEYKANAVVVSFKDNGPGITENGLKGLFIPFVTTKKKGSGLGLPISQRIVESHGGRIEVESTPGNGSVFRVVLPSVDDSDSRARQSG